MKSQCPVSTLPTKSQATRGAITGTVTNGVATAGAMVTYTCNAGYRIVPLVTVDAAVTTTKVVMCDGPTGIFTDLNFECVRKY